MLHKQSYAPNGVRQKNSKTSQKRSLKKYGKEFPGEKQNLLIELAIALLFFDYPPKDVTM